MVQSRICSIFLHLFYPPAFATLGQILVKTLGIFVGSERFADYLWALAEAAGKEGMNLHIHFFGAGVRLVPAADLQRLPASAQISICREGARMLPSENRRNTCWRRWLVPPEQMARIIRACDRHVFL
jgi:hypothetical protein